jgi:molybdenum cofactor biosynthesis enzyme
VDVAVADPPFEATEVAEALAARTFEQAINMAHPLMSSLVFISSLHRKLFFRTVQPHGQPFTGLDTLRVALVSILKIFSMCEVKTKFTAAKTQFVPDKYGHGTNDMGSGRVNLDSREDPS